MYRTNRFAKGGVTKGPSHEKGGIKFRVKSTGQMVELEGGEGVINKAVMSSGAKVKLNGQELSPCEAASKLNQMQGGGVPFDCEKFQRGGIVQYYDTAVSPIYPSSVNSLSEAYDDVEYLQMGGALVFAKGGVVDVVDLQSLTATEQRKALQAMGAPPSASNREALAMMLNKIEAEGTGWLKQALGRDIGREIGLTPGQVKAAVKQEYFGIDEFKMGDKWYRMVKSSEEADRIEYSELIESAYRWAAENGIAIE